MSLPKRTAAVARECEGWTVHHGGLVPHDARWLRFAISRVLLNAEQLAAGWQVWDGAPRPLLSDSPPCLIARRRVRRLRIRQPSAGARNQATAAGQPHTVHTLPTPQWLVGGVVRFRKDRWAYAPRLFPRNQRVKATKLAKKYAHDLRVQQQAQAQPLASGHAPAPGTLTEEQRRLLEKQAAAWEEPFVDVHRLFQHLKEQDDPDELLACHYGCRSVSAGRRARCLQERHLAWGDRRDNAYHAHQHDRGLPAQARKPAEFVFPSAQPH